jgi:hypothetical protein
MLKFLKIIPCSSEFLLPFAFCLLPFAFCLLPFAFCLLPFAFCLLPFAFMASSPSAAQPSSHNSFPEKCGVHKYRVYE